MNQTIAYSDFTAPTRIQSHQHESLLKKIRDRLSRALKSRHEETNKKDFPPTFIEANLLDDALGPEIKRTLRV